MAIMATPRKFSMQQAFEILLRRPASKEIVAFLTDCKTTSLENTMEMVYPTGGAGNVYIGNGFAHSKRATFNVTVATFNREVMAQQNGSEVVVGNHDITYYDRIEPDANGQYFTRWTAIGSLNNEIGWVYILNSDGTYAKTYTQAAVAAPGSFTYSTATKEITFDASDAPLAGEWIACAYTWTTASNAAQIAVTSDGIPPVVLVSAYGLAVDTCTGEKYNCLLEGQAQVDGNWNFDVSADGEPVIQTLNMEFVKGCFNNDMYKFTVYTEDEADPTQAATPTATPAGGTYDAAQTVTLNTATVGASIHYTTDGTDPTPASTLYSAPITIPASASTTLKAIAVLAGMNNSNIMIEDYIIS